MSRLSEEKRTQILTLLVEGMSMRSTARACDVSFNTVARYLNLAGAACKLYHDENVVGIKGVRDVQCDEIWSFIYAKDKVADYADPWDAVGTVWTFTGLDEDSRLMISHLVRKSRGIRSATAFMRDMKGRLNKRPRLATDSLASYGPAARKVFGDKVRIIQNRKGEATDHPTSYVERMNHTIRMRNRRFTRDTNAFSKRFNKHVAMMNLMTVHYNFCWIHGSLKVSPAMEAGLTDTLRDYDWLTYLVDEYEAKHIKRKKPGPPKGAKYRPRKPVK